MTERAPSPAAPHEGYNHNALNDAYEEFYRNKAKKHDTSPEPTRPELDTKKKEREEAARGEVDKALDDDGETNNSSHEKSPEELKTEAIKAAIVFWNDMMAYWGNKNPGGKLFSLSQNYFIKAAFGDFDNPPNPQTPDGSRFNAESMRDYLKTIAESWSKHNNTEIRPFATQAAEILAMIEKYEAAAGEVVDGEIVPDDKASPKHDKKDTVDADAETDHINPEALADAQKLASAYWNKRRKNAQDRLKNPKKGDRGFDFDIAKSEAYLKRIKDGEFFEDFPLTGLYDGKRHNTHAKSVYGFFKSIADSDLEAYKATTSPEVIAAQEEQIRIAAEIVKAIEAIGSKDTYTPAPDKSDKSDDAPDSKTKPPETDAERQHRLDEYKRLAEEAAKASAEAYEKSPARAKAREREFWRHYNELKIEQMAERHRVEAEDEERERLKKEAEAKLAAEAQALANKQAGIVREIDNAAKTKKDSQGKKIGRDERIKKLHELALTHSGTKGPGDIDDLGIYAVKKISRLATSSKLNPFRLLPSRAKKDAQFTLQKMAVQGQNKAALNKIPIMRLTRNRSVNKGRFGTGREMKRKAKN